VSPAVADARRLAVGITLAAHDRDRDRARLRQLIGDVTADLVPMLIEALAALASEGLIVATRDPDVAREALAGVAGELAATYGPFSFA
jgi:hypothetical protein